MENEAIKQWLDISLGLMRRVFGDLAEMADALGAMPSDTLIALVDEQRSRVDHALVALATADGEAGVQAISAQLERPVLMALAHRWSAYHQAWKPLAHQPDPPLWVPPTQAWRAVFLAMTSEGIHSTAAAAQLWPAHFAAPPG